MGKDAALTRRHVWEKGGLDFIDVGTSIATAAGELAQ